MTEGPHARGCWAVDLCLGKGGEPTMTEQDWLTGDDPRALLDHLLARGAAGDRKCRLFAVACASHGREDDEPRIEARARAAQALAERIADGAATSEELSAAWNTSWIVLNPDATKAARSYTKPDDLDCPQAEKAALLRDLFGDPFRPSAINPAWVTPTVASLARAAYEERMAPRPDLDPVRLSVLADALEDAGCSDAAILGHLRGPGPHVRGCWALDLVLGKEDRT
jgi:hypothetical protein